MATPKLRFSGFQKEWEKKRLDTFLQRVSKPIEVIQDEQYFQIGIRSHGKGIFHKESVSGKDLGNKRVFWVVPNALVVNIVFAWERAIAVTSESEQGLIASHRFPMYLPKNKLSDVKFLRFLFITNKGQSYLELASPGGAGRNKTLGQSNFAELKIDLPCVKEQTQIASFLSTVDEKISQLTQKYALLSQYKQGMMQKLFSQQFRFKADDGSEFGEWEEIHLKKLVKSLDAGVSVNSEDESPLKDEFSVLKTSCITTGYFDENKRKRVTNQQEIDRLKEPLLDDSILLSRMNTPLLVGMNAYVEKAPSKTFLPDRLWQLKLNQKITNTKWLAFYLGSDQGLNKLRDLASGTSNSMKNIKKSDVLNIELLVPNLKEQTKIANFLSAIDQKIEVVAQQVEQAKTWKKGLLQQMFV